jgi:hypothetical protein
MYVLPRRVLTRGLAHARAGRAEVEKCGAGRAATGENARPASAMQLENENTAANAKKKKRDPRCQRA